MFQGKSLSQSLSNMVANIWAPVISRGVESRNYRPKWWCRRLHPQAPCLPQPNPQKESAWTRRALDFISEILATQWNKSPENNPIRGRRNSLILPVSFPPLSQHSWPPRGNCPARKSSSQQARKKRTGWAPCSPRLSGHCSSLFQTLWTDLGKRRIIICWQIG